MYSENLTDEQWRKWSVINYIFTILKNVLFSIAVCLNKNNKPQFGEHSLQIDHYLFEKPHATHFKR
jgi:hypothetical protein